MRQHWMRWPRRCCTFPKRRDSSQPKDASPSRRGSTSFSPRRKERERETQRPGGGVTIAFPAHLHSEPQSVSFALFCALTPSPHRDTPCLSRSLGDGQAAGQVQDKRREQQEPSCRDQERCWKHSFQTVVIGGVAALPYLPGLSITASGWRREEVFDSENWCILSLFMLVFSFFLQSYNLYWFLCGLKGSHVMCWYLQMLCFSSRRYLLKSFVP